MKKLILASIVLTVLLGAVASGQTNHGSPANWRYRGGNANSTKYQPIRSDAQVLDSFEIKWSTPYISGDVAPLIGNMVNNRKRVGDLPYAPNEIAAFVGDTLFIIDGFGKIYARRSLYDNFQWINEITCLFDTLQTQMDGTTTTNHVIGLSSVEYMPVDSVANAFIVGYDESLDSVRLLSRLAVNINSFAPNTYASVTPVGGQISEGRMTYYAAVNQSNPSVDENYDSMVDPQPYFRGMAMFPATKGTDCYPFSDIGDEQDNRVFYAGDITQGPVSFKNMESGALGALVPCKPTPQVGSVNIESGINSDTYSDVPYSSAIEYLDNIPASLYYDIDMSNYTDLNAVPYIKSYFVDIKDNNTEEQGFVLITEEYNGHDNSIGTPKLYLADATGFMLTEQSNQDAPPFEGTVNHYWSVAVGDIDGRSSNSFLPYYPNNGGKELIVTQSSRISAVPSSKLYIMKYNSGDRLEKPDGSGKTLFQLDTICSYKVNGWVAAVNDIDGKDDLKDEIFLVDGSQVTVLTMRDYDEEDFRGGNPFDTVLVKRFEHQTISYLSVADIDGDERNDMVITTHDSTYIFGSIIPNTLNVTMPFLKNDLYCLGDTVHIEWENYIAGQDFVDIIFRPYENDIPIPSKDTTIVSRHPNPGEVESYDLHADRTILGMSGRFIVRSVSKPQYQIDSTSVVRFSEPEVWPIVSDTTIYEMGYPITLKGGNFCNDSMVVQYMDIDSTWVDWDVIIDDDHYEYEHTTEIPCVSLYNCTGVDSVPSVLRCRYILHKSIFADTLGYFKLKVKPYRFPLEWEKSENANPNIMFSWDSESIALPCDTVIFSFSFDEGKTFSQGRKIDVTQNQYYWQVPKTGPVQVYTRFCCENSCVRIDTLMDPWMPQYVNIIAPNPFRPYVQELQIVYQVPETGKVDIYIYDQNNRMVAHPVKARRRTAGIMYTDYWDGIRDYDDSPCAVGMYYVIFEHEDGQKEIHPVFIRK
jgi:hypothetical protein